MKHIDIKKFSQTSLVQQLQHQLGGTLSVNDNESILQIDNEVAQGTISSFTKRNGVSYVSYNIVFLNDVVIKVTSDHRVNYEFMYSLESNLLHHFGIESRIRQIEKFRTVIFCYGKGLESVLHFTKNQEYVFSSINISDVVNNNKEKVNDVFIQRLQSIFSLTDSNDRIAYIGSLNLKIADAIQQLNESAHNGLVRALLIEATIKTIIALQLQQHSDDLENMDLNIGSLTRKEMAVIQEISLMIKKHPENEYTISSICQQSGLSKAKLQEGFRLMHGLTVTKYIRHTRILAAEHLIKTTDLNISEVVYSIGLTSRSYFSKIFKKKYNCSPKDYQLNRQLSGLSA